MIKFKRLATSMIAVVFIAGASGVATAQSLSIADSDSIFVDGNSFKVVPGKAKGNASALIDELDARGLGPGTIIFRSGNRLYLVDAPTVEGTRLGSDRRDYGSDRRDYGSDRYGSDRRDYGSDRRDYGSDRRDYGSDRRDYGSDRRDYGSDRRDYGSDRRDYGSDRYGSDRRDYGSDRRDYGSDRYGSDRRDYGSDRRDYGSDRRDYAGDRVVVNDAEYAQYKLKKIFSDNWTTGDSK
jgi:hypothetical protein